MMNNTLKIVLSTVGWCLLLAYIIFAAKLCSAEEKAVPLRDVQITIEGDKHNRLINEDMIFSRIRESRLLQDSSQIVNIDTDSLERFLEKMSFVADARIHINMDGIMTVSARQRTPVARFMLSNGYDFYLSQDGWILPSGKGTAAYVPVITGSFSLPFPPSYEGSIESAVEDEKKSSRDYLYLHKLITFVKLVGSNAFWNAQIVQINVNQASGAAVWKEPKVEFIPRVGRHIVILGSLDDAPAKLEKLMLFYRRALDYEGWEQYRTIDLRYDNQVVCRR